MAHEQTLRLRILLSFHYYKDTDLDALFAKYFRPPYPEVFLDSGGFSAATQGATIDLDAYAAYIKRYGHLITTYANLDVIGDAKATRANQRRMEREHGLAPIPVFHVKEDWRYLEEYIERYPYIALGGMVPYMLPASRAHLMPWLVRAFKLATGADGAPRSVYHGFGATSWEVVKAFRWYSVDSSSWGQGFRFGQAPLFDDRAGKFHKVNLGDHTICYQHAREFRALGFDPGDFADRSRYSRAKMAALSALSYLHAEAWLRRRHGEVYIPRRDGRDAGHKDDSAPAVLRAHLADANPQRFRDADAGLKLHLCENNTVGAHDTREVVAGLAEHNITSVEGAHAAAGVKVHLSDTSNGINYHDADAGLKLHLAEHSLDRGGVGDTSRALDVLEEQRPTKGGKAT